MTVFLSGTNKERINTVLLNRGLWGDAKTYPDDVKEKELEWSLVFNERLRVEAIKHGYSLVEIAKAGEDVTKVLDAIRVNHQ